MSHRLDRDEVRAALHLADADALFSVLTGWNWPDDALQLLGDAVLMVARERGRQGMESAARRCVLELLDRGWRGDSELAAQIESALGWGPAQLLRPLPVDLEELAGVLEGDPLTGGGRIDLRTGEVCPQLILEDAEAVDDDEDDERWLRVDSQGSYAGYRDMELFIDTVEDSDLADHLPRQLCSGLQGGLCLEAHAARMFRVIS